LLAGLAASGTSAFFLADEPIHRWLLDNPDNGRNSAAKVFSTMADPAVLFGLVSAGYLLGSLNHSLTTRKTFLLAGESLLITELVIQMAKTGIGRARPYNEEGAFSFHPLTLKEKWQSFPSGHSASAWALASSLAASTQNPYLDAFFYTLAAGVSLSRVLLDKHFASDVVAGSLLGFFIGKKITQPAKQEPKKVAFQLIILRRFLAFGLTYYF